MYIYMYNSGQPLHAGPKQHLSRSGRGLWPPGDGSVGRRAGGRKEWQEPPAFGQVLSSLLIFPPPPLLLDHWGQRTQPRNRQSEKKAKSESEKRFP